MSSNGEGWGRRNVGGLVAGSAKRAVHSSASQCKGTRNRVLLLIMDSVVINMLIITRNMVIKSQTLIALENAFTKYEGTTWVQRRRGREGKRTSLLSPFAYVGIKQVFVAIPQWN